MILSSICRKIHKNHEKQAVQTFCLHGAVFRVFSMERPAVEGLLWETAEDMNLSSNREGRRHDSQILHKSV